ncbi:MAG: type 1 glutamine amidotransferase domain-containing protein [Armatimonadota bacterium]
MSLSGKSVAVLAAEDYQVLEVWYPLLRLTEEGAEVKVVGVKGGPKTVNSKDGYPCDVDVSADEASAADFDAVVIPGGWAPDYLRRCDRTVQFVKDMDAGGKVVAAICHGGWMLASAEIVQGRRATCFYAIRDDLAHAGADYVDQEVAVDDHIITSRKPEDLPAFCRAIIQALRG